MGKYSSDSDSDRRHRKYHKDHRRSASSDSSGSPRHSRRRIQNRDNKRQNSSYGRDRRSGSRGRSHTTKLHRRSPSRDRHYRSHSKNRHRTRRSRSKSYIREYVSRKTRSSSSSSRGSRRSMSKSRSNNKKAAPPKDKVKQKNTETEKDLVLPAVDSKVLDEINDFGFTQKQFSSKVKKVSENIVIDLKRQTIKVPEVEPVEPDSIFHHNLFLNEEARVEKWVKELYSFRQKALQQTSTA